VAKNVKGLQHAGGLVGHRERSVEYRDLAARRKLRPVGGFLRKMEVVVEDGDLHGFTCMAEADTAAVAPLWAIIAAS
jgi:hypothetical protein